MQEQETGFISKYNEGLCVNTDPDLILMSILDMSLHRQMGSDRDLQSSASSVSLPSVKKAPKKRRISIGSLFRRKKDSKRKSRELNGGVDGIASIESIHSEMCTDKNSIFSTNTSSDNGLTSISKQVGDFIECPLCLLRHSKDRFPEIMTCHHRSCVDCLRQYLRIEISESRVNISCPECTERFNPHDIRLILSDDVLMEKYEEFMLRRWLVADPDCRWCPAPDCGYAVIAFGCASCPKLTCGREGCGTEFCYHCKQIWHPNQTCDAARQERAQSLRLRTIRSSSISYSQESGAAVDDIKPCPRCAAYIIKMNDGSCNHMTCAVCGCEFCWLCMKEISDLHYLSPSGCTFWGKKPWSRKKKILWQLGTLVGAPVGIALIAGIAIPAMIIGIPVYVGRKIHNRYEGKDVSKHKRNLAIAGGVTLSVIVSPVVAAVTVDTTSVAEARHNPSIGEGSVGGLTGSLSASGSHMDRIGAIRDNLSETASTMALAGASITGSLSGSAMVNCFNRLEVQADVQKEQYSLSGESGTVSLGTVSDNASTKAMAGSILNSYIPLDKEGNSMEVQVDIESKPSKFRHNSGSSSVDDGSATRSHIGGSSSGLPEGKSSATKWSKEATAGKKSKSGKLRKKGNMKINETREDMDAQLLEQQSTNSSEFEAPSLSDSMPSVADSHSSHFSEFSCSDLESMKTSCSHGSSDYHARFATVSILPEVENDRLENSPHQCSISVLTNTASCSEVPQLNHIAEEHSNNGLIANVDLYFSDTLKETNNNHSHQTMELKVAIQTEI
ncbi:E3 ubiquitin-protein ligase RNF19A isoform X3 [Loxodonta africana]|uniref:E3 ubiquitin-protein ligase RNF19A isoform X3 n=1 Tax=Loxodonta africana TaxID=9785 RepID=UPI000C81372A|nr:E3 ubiquitin-protein ligase RNF19A isoform X3 [Loxodonta africana]